jgi:hypothetical protein
MSNWKPNFIRGPDPQIRGGVRRRELKMKIFCLFNLKPGVREEDYLHWARTLDIPNVRSLDSVHAFSVSRVIQRLRSDQDAPYTFIETIDISSIDDYRAGAGSDEFQKIASMFTEFADDPLFMLAESIE